MNSASTLYRMPASSSVPLPFSRGSEGIRQHDVVQDVDGMARHPAVAPGPPIRPRVRGGEKLRNDETFYPAWSCEGVSGEVVHPHMPDGSMENLMTTKPFAFLLAGLLMVPLLKPALGNESPLGTEMGHSQSQLSSGVFHLPPIPDLNTVPWLNEHS